MYITAQFPAGFSTGASDVKETSVVKLSVGETELTIL